MYKRWCTVAVWQPRMSSTMTQSSGCMTSGRMIACHGRIVRMQEHSASKHSLFNRTIIPTESEATTTWNPDVRYKAVKNFLLQPFKFWIILLIIETLLVNYGQDLFKSKLEICPKDTDATTHHTSMAIMPLDTVMYFKKQQDEDPSLFQWLFAELGPNYSTWSEVSSFPRRLFLCIESIWVVSNLCTDKRPK